jgi:hypothetical protein
VHSNKPCQIFSFLKEDCKFCTEQLFKLALPHGQSFKWTLNKQNISTQEIKCGTNYHHEFTGKSDVNVDNFPCDIAAGINLEAEF